MKKSELKKLVGSEIKVVLFNDKEFTGKLSYVEEFSEKYGFRKPGLFYIGNIGFRVSHLKKVKHVYVEIDII